MAIKLDMGKVYDRLKQKFIQNVLLPWFSKKLTNYIMERITNTSFFVLLNGILDNIFRPRRGLRQGDHI